MATHEMIITNDIRVSYFSVITPYYNHLPPRRETLFYNSIRMHSQQFKMQLKHYRNAFISNLQTIKIPSSKYFISAPSQVTLVSVENATGAETCWLINRNHPRHEVLLINSIFNQATQVHLFTIQNQCFFCFY